MARSINSTWLISGGYCSRLYIIEQANNNETGNGKSKKECPTKFLLRLLGGKFVNLDDKKQDNILKVMNEIEIELLYFKLGDAGIGPKVLGVFPGGR